MELYASSQGSDETERCVVQIENPDGEDTILMEVSTRVCKGECDQGFGVTMVTVVWW